MGRLIALTTVRVPNTAEDKYLARTWDSLARTERTRWEHPPRYVLPGTTFPVSVLEGGLAEASALVARGVAAWDN